MAEEIKFGRKQFFNDTPVFVKRLRDSLNFFCAGVVVFLPWIAEKLHTTTDDLTTWLGIFMLGFNTVAKMFGVQPNDTNGNPVTERNQISNP